MKMDNNTRSEYWEIERLKEWDKNPRKATGKESLPYGA